MGHQLFSAYCHEADKIYMRHAATPLRACHTPIRLQLLLCIILHTYYDSGKYVAHATAQTFRLPNDKAKAAEASSKDMQK